MILNFLFQKRLRIRDNEGSVSVKTLSWNQLTGMEVDFNTVKTIDFDGQNLTFYEFTDLSGNKDLFTGISEFHFTALSDDITGRDVGDIIYTYEGDDYIFTNGGDDIIYAGSGKDIIEFMGQNEVLSGGSDADTFVLSSKSSNSFNTTITDFNLEDGDVLDLRSLASVSRDEIDTSFIDDDTLEVSIGNLGKVTLDNFSSENSQNIKDNILFTETIQSLSNINAASAAIDPATGYSGDLLNFSEFMGQNDEVYINADHGFVSSGNELGNFQGSGSAYYNSIVGTQGVDIIQGENEGVVISYAGYQGDDIIQGGGDAVLDYGLEERMSEFFNSYYDRPGVTVKLGDVSTPTLDELIEDTNDIDTGNIAEMMAGTARDTFGDTDIMQGINNVVGTSSSDVLIGSSEDDKLAGGRGDDFIYGQAGSDVITGGQGSDVFYYDISEIEYGADVITDFNLLQDSLFIGGFDNKITSESLAIMSGEEMSGETWQNIGDSLYKDYAVGIEKLSGDFEAILYLEDVNYSTEEVNLLLKDILTDVAA